MANRAYKFRIYPNDAQKILFARTFGCVRMVYNHWLDRKIKQYEENKANVTYTVCAKEMAEMKKTEAYAFLREVDSIALQQSLRHLDTAFQNFFKQPKTGFPRFKSKKRNKSSYSTICINGNITISNGYLKLPKIGQVRLKQHRAVPNGYRLKSVTLEGFDQLGALLIIEPLHGADLEHLHAQPVDPCRLLPSKLLRQLIDLLALILGSRVP